MDSMAAETETLIEKLLAWTETASPTNQLLA